MQLNKWLGSRSHMLRVCLILIRLWARSLAMRESEGTRGIVTFDFILPPLFFRYQLTLAVVFLAAGYRVNWVVRPSMFARSVEFLSLWQLLPATEIKWISRWSLSSDAWSGGVVLTDRDVAGCKGYHRRIVRVGRIERQPTAGSIMMPFWGHPEFLVYYLKSGQGEGPLRSIRLSFVGNCDAKHYSSHGIIPRARAKCLIVEGFVGEVCRLSEWEDKAMLHFDSALSVLFVDRCEVGLSVPEYTAVLKRSVFFLVLPGIDSYVTHSLHECLLCGCVPILAADVYGDNWVHGVNCLQYDSEESLVGVVRMALSMTVEQCVVLQRGAGEELRSRFSMTDFVSGMSQEGVEQVLVCNV